MIYQYVNERVWKQRKKTKQTKPNQTRRRRALAHALGRERKTESDAGRRDVEEEW